jgi:hypothetical protein
MRLLSESCAKASLRANSALGGVQPCFTGVVDLNGVERWIPCRCAASRTQAVKPQEIAVRLIQPNISCA